MHVDIGRLERELRRSVRGEVRFDAGSCALYATDASNYRQVPIGVVIPQDADDVAATLAACREQGAPVLSRGGGTSLAGQTCNVAVVLDFSKRMDRILEIDPERRLARVQPGVVLDDLRAAAERNHLTFGPDPATHDRCTLGGMIGNNSCGVHSLTAGMTDANVEALDVLTYDGARLRVGATPEDALERAVAGGGRAARIYARLRDLRDRHADAIRTGFPDIPRRVSGYNLPQLLPEWGFHIARALVGSEGTCVTVLEATVRLVESPRARVLLVLGYEDIYRACDHVPELLDAHPIGLEGFDNLMIEDRRKKHLLPANVALLPQGGGWLLLEFGASGAREAEAQARRLMDRLRGEPGAPSMHLFTDRGQQRRIWQVREAALGTTAIIPGAPSTWPGWEDSAVPPDRLGDYLRDLRKLIDGYGYIASFYGHFGQGCLHTRLDFDLAQAESIRRFRSFMEDAADLVVRYGGSLSGEHGDGQARAELLPRMFSPQLMEAFRAFKAVWDPDNRMNPGKLVEPRPLDTDLRLAEYDPAPVRTHFAFPHDGNSFNHAALRCVGVGKCRQHEGGTMCPSYMVTREEQHSTRGRARLLYEMLHGNPLRGGWREESVREALDLCLACKGCRGDCPVQVDMATYKAEFLAHHYAGRLRPVTAYSMGLIALWARAAEVAPGLANALTGLPLLGDLVRRAAGVAPQRHVPRFANRTFTSWFHRRPPRNEGGPRVILWPDTFNNHFHPQTALAAVEVLEAAGFQVAVPREWLCCGRPLYDYGFLTQAKSLLQRTMRVLGPEIDAGVPVVGLEPSCVAVFRDELTNLFPHDERAGKLSRQTFLLSELLQAQGYRPPALQGKAVVHGHCHHKALMGMGDEEALLKGTGLHYEVLDSGCCGMAGAFGFERDHYEVSVACGERVLLPAVRRAEADTLVIADGFSCREQIAQLTDRRALHLAEVLQMALHGEPVDRYPEERFPDEEAKPSPLWVGAAAGVAAGLLAAARRR